MKKTSSLFRNSTALVVGAFMVLAPAAAMARENGHAGRGAPVGHFSGGARVGVRSFRGGYGGGYYRGGVYFGIHAAPYGYGYYPGYAYGPGYVYGPGYAVAPPPPPCGQPSYDAYGNAIQDPACYAGQQPYPQQYNAAPQGQYPPQQQQQYSAPQQQYPAQPAYPPQQQQYYGQPQQYGR